MKTRADPLSPEEIQNYLASLSIKHRKRQPSPLAKTPSPEFIDANSPAVKDLTSLLSGFGEENDSHTKKQPLPVCDISSTAKRRDDDRLGNSSIDLSDTSKEALEYKVVQVSSQVKPYAEPNVHVQGGRNQSVHECVSHGSKPKEKHRGQNASSISNQKDQETALAERVENGEQYKKQVSMGKQSERKSEFDSKVFFSLGGDEQEEDGDTSNGDEDDDTVTPRNDTSEASDDPKQQHCRNGVHSENDSYSNRVSNHVDRSVTNGHIRDSDINNDSTGITEYRVTRPKQSVMKRSVSDSESIKRSISDASGFAPMLPGINKASPLYKTLMMREMSNMNKQNDQITLSSRPIPTPQERASFRKSLESSSHMIFHASTGLPLQSSPAPIKKRASDTFEYDQSLNNPRAIKNSLSCVNLDERNKNDDEPDKDGRFYSTSAPASTNCLLGNFEESLLNGRIEPSGVVEGFIAEIGASGAFCPKHVTLPVTAFFFNLSDDNAPSPYLGHINLEKVGKRGYHIPKKGTVQVTLFNPNKTVVKMFVVVYDLTDMPANCQTFLRQRTLYMPVTVNRNTKPEDVEQPVYLRYLIHLRFQSSKSGKVYLHTDMRMIFARDKFEYDSRVANYELRSFTEAPTNPKFSPKR